MQSLRVEAFEHPVVGAPRQHPVFQTERLERNRRKFHPRDLQSSVAKPNEVERFSAQGHEHTPVGDLQSGPMLLEHLLHGSLVKADQSEPPALVPKLWLQRYCSSE